MKMNKWFTGMIISAVFTFTVIVLELLGIIHKAGFLLGLVGIELTLIFGLLGTVSSLDTTQTLKDHTNILNKQTDNQGKIIGLLEEIRDFLRGS